MLGDKSHCLELKVLIYLHLIYKYTLDTFRAFCYGKTILKTVCVQILRCCIFNELK